MDAIFTPTPDNDNLEAAVMAALKSAATTFVTALKPQLVELIRDNAPKPQPADFAEMIRNEMKANGDVLVLDQIFQEVRDLVRDEVNAAETRLVEEVDRKGDDMVEDRKFERRVEDIIDNYDLSSAIESEMDDYDFDSRIESCIDSYDFQPKVQEAFENIDFGAEVARAVQDNHVVRLQLYKILDAYFAETQFILRRGAA
jgi:hypothetical protein